MSVIEIEMLDMGRRARAAAEAVRIVAPEVRTAALRACADALSRSTDDILAANGRDVAAARANGLSEALIDRLALTPERLSGVADAVAEVADLPDPLGRELARWTRPNGLDIARVSTPIGVLATGMDPKASAQFLGSEVEKWRGVIKTAGITLD